MYARHRVFVPPLPAVMLASLLVAVPVSAQAPVDLAAQPYLLDTGLLSRSISFENPTGAREPQWLGTKYTNTRKGESMKGG